MASKAIGVVVAVRLPGEWLVGFPISPGQALDEATWTGPRHRMCDGIRALVRRHQSRATETLAASAA